MKSASATMSFRLPFLVKSPVVAGIILLSMFRADAASSTLVGWSEYGLWETDGSDVSVYSMVPPYSTIHAQLMTGGNLVTNPGGITVTYEAVADSTGSINTTSVGKSNFNELAVFLFGAPLAPDEGLEGYGMPGASNQPQLMEFDAAQKQFTALGIPITPYDDLGRVNNLPLMKLVARDASGNVLATTRIAVPVSDGMDCRACHGSGADEASRPGDGWVWETDPVRDYKLNILHTHDNHQLGTTAYSGALETAGYNSAGLVATVLRDGRPISCLACHASNAVPGSGQPERKTLTQIMHTKHAFSVDPERLQPLTTLNDSASCLRCHAGPDTLRLRGVHHNAIEPDGSRTMQCTSCHVSMSDLGSPERQGWFDQPDCQSCHTGTATSNNGEIRYTNVIDPATGLVRQPVNDTFATESNVPSEGFSLFRLSHDHGDLNCQACHGSAHAELGSMQANDNVQSQMLQGHAGRMADCDACHTSVPRDRNGGPHGLHPMDSKWARDHEGGRSTCKACHGADYRGGVLGAMLDANTYSKRNLWQGNQVGCYNCHDGPNTEHGGGVTPSIAGNRSATTTQETPVEITLSASGSGLSYRAVAQPSHGTVHVNGNVATYLPSHGYVGSDSFQFAANNGSVDSNLATVSLTISASPSACTLTAETLVPYAAKPDLPVPFRARAELSQCTDTISFDWDFGDGSDHLQGANPAHVYTAPGDYSWTLTASANGTSETVTGVLTISETLGPVLDVTLVPLNPWEMQISWPADGIPTSLESTEDLSSPYPWQPNIHPPELDPSGQFWTLPVDLLEGNFFWRVRRVP